MSTPLDTTPAPLPEVDLGDGRTVLSYEEGALYRVQMPNGEIQGFRPKVEATPENALDDIVTNPPTPEPAPVPASVTRRQLFLWLNGLGITRAALRTQLAGNEAALIELEEATEFQRAHPLVAQLGQTLGLNSAQIDDAFRAAALL